MGIKKKSDEVVKGLTEIGGWETKEARNVKDVFRGNIFVDATRGIVYINEIMEMVLDMFEEVMKLGPMAKEPCIGVKVTMTDCKLHEDAIHRGPGQMYPAVREGIRMAFAQAGAVLFEPIQKMEFEVPANFIGSLSSLVQQKRGQIIEMTQDCDQAKIVVKLPVAETIGLSSDLRSATEGYAIMSIMDQTFERLPGELQPKVLMQIRQRKGLSEGEVFAG